MKTRLSSREEGMARELWLHEEAAAALHFNEPRFPFEFPYENSPVDSFTESNETESEEEDEYLAGLAKRVARSMLEEDDTFDESLAVGYTGLQQQEKSMEASMGLLSPQSSASSWSSTSVLSSNGSTHVPSQVSSPSSSFGAKDDLWDLIHIAAGKSVKLQRPEDATSSGLHHTSLNPKSNQLHLSHSVESYPSLFSTQFKGFPANNSWSSSAPSDNKGLTVETQPEHHPYSLQQRTKGDHHQSLRSQLRPPKPGSTLNWSSQIKPVQQQHVNAESRRTIQKAGICQPAFVPLQSSRRSSNQPIGGTGMRAVFLGPKGAGRECGGTGVFLPRRRGDATDSRRKPSACSTVLLPSRVVQALNLNIKDTCLSDPAYRTSSQGAGYIPLSSISTRLSNISVQSCTWDTGAGCEKKAMQSMPSTPEHMASEVVLPNEWTY